MTDLVVLSLEAWDQVWRRNQYLLAGLLRNNSDLRVLFVEPPEDPLHAAISRHRPRLGAGLSNVGGVEGIGDGRLWRFQTTKWLPRSVDGRADDRLSAAVERAVKRIHFTRSVLWINDPGGAVVLERTGWPSLYDITDDWIAADRTPRENSRLRRAEDLLMRRCDEIVVCSPALLVSKGPARPIGASPVTLIGNAVDLEGYRRPFRRPADLPSGRIALYAGTIHTDRIDLPLTESIGESLHARSMSLVMVGPAAISPEWRQRLERAGVVLLGPRVHTSVPDYLRSADVLIVPHLIDEFTKSLDPIKAYEYRAARRPVVATGVPGFDDTGDPFVTVADRAKFGEAVIAVLEDRLATPDQAGDLGGPAVPDWSERVREMAEVLRRVGQASRP